MNPQANQTEMKNPPSEQTEMTKPGKMTQVKVLQPVALKRTGKIHQPGEVVDMTADEMAEFCNRRFKGPYAHTGELANTKAPRHYLRRAMPLRDWEAAEARRKDMEALEKDDAERAAAGAD